MSPATKSTRRRRTWSVLIGAMSVAMVAFAAPAHADWPDTLPLGGPTPTIGDASVNNATAHRIVDKSGEIGLVDTTAGPDTTGSTLVYAGQKGQAAGDIQLLIPNVFKNGDTIDLALFDRSAIDSNAGQGNADADHQLTWSGTPTVKVDPNPYAGDPADVHKRVGCPAGCDLVHIGPIDNDPFSTQSETDPPIVDTTTTTGPPSIAPAGPPPTINPSLVTSSRATGIGTDIVRLTLGSQATGEPVDFWVVNLSGLKLDVGPGATPGEVRVVPFAYNGAPQTDSSNQTDLFRNLADNPLTVGGSPDPVINSYTVPAYVSPITFSQAEPSVLRADGTTQIMGDITIKETNNFSLQDGTYTIRPDSTGVPGGLGLVNVHGDNPVTVTLTNNASGETVSGVGVTAGPGGNIHFNLNQPTPAIVDAANQGKVTITIHNVQLSTGTARTFPWQISGGSIDNGTSAFLVVAGISNSIPAGFAGDPNLRRGVRPDSAFGHAGNLLGINLTTVDPLAPEWHQGVNQQDIVPPALTFTGQAQQLPSRIGGSNRYETAAKIAKAQDNGDRNYIVLASGENFPDALSASYLADEINLVDGGTGNSVAASVLLTRQGFLPDVTLDALRELDTQTVYIVGGTGAVSTAVENKLKSTQIYSNGGTVDDSSHGNLHVVRLGGANRYSTNRIVNQYAAAFGNNTLGTATGRTNITFGVGSKITAFVATGANYPDALTAGVATDGGPFADPMPLILTPSTGLGADAAEQLNNLGIEQAVIVGGEDVVTADAATAITGKGIAVKRISGADRYETATKLADFETLPWTSTSGRSGGLGFDGPATGAPFGWGFNQTQGAYLATGRDFADALAGATLAGRDGSPILLTSVGDALQPTTKAWLDLHRTASGGDASESDHSGYNGVVAFGLAGAVSNAALTAANNAIS